MAALRSLPILLLLLVYVSSAPTTKDKPKAKDDSQGLTLLLEDAMFDDNDETTAGDQQQVREESKTLDKTTDSVKDTQDPVGGEDEEDDDGSNYSSEFDSFPSWYLDQLMTVDGNDSEPSNSDEYQKYKDELNELILDVKLYQVYHSIKTLKGVLDDLLDDQREEIEGNNLGELNGKEKQEEEEAEKGEAWEKLSFDDSEEEEDEEAEEGNEGQSVKVLTDRQIVIAKQLGSLKNQHLPSQERSSRRIKRDLSFGDDEEPDVGELAWNDGKPNLRWLMKYDDDNYLHGEGNVDEENGFEMTKDQIQDLLSTFFPNDGVTSLPTGNEVNINVGDQSLSQQIWYPSKRGLHRGSMDRNYFSRLPTLEGMKKRRRTFIPIRRSGTEKAILDPYDVTLTPHDREMLTRNQIAKLARRLAQNTKYGNSGVPVIKEFTNGPAGDVNLWFENNPMYNIGVDDNIGDTYGLMEVDLPRTSPNDAARFQRGRYNHVWRRLPRLERRSHIVEEPSLPGPYQGYFMEGQLWHDMLTKRSASTTLKPKNLKIGGPNAWGNFIFISDKGLLPNDGEWFSQSFGDNIGNNEAGGPTAIETEGMWDDGDDEEDEEQVMNKDEEDWIKRLFGLTD